VRPCRLLVDDWIGLTGGRSYRHIWAGDRLNMWDTFWPDSWRGPERYTFGASVGWAVSGHAQDYGIQPSEQCATRGIVYLFMSLFSFPM
jgi:hypothetical protein